jgi:3-hydroxyisobutyrate dehydrogenase-like beta-hydroxyacid dehydrogenase
MSTAPTPSPARVAVLGLGEAGGRYARDLAAAGCDVAGFDPVVRDDLPDAVRRARSIEDAVAGAGLVLSLTGASAAEAAAAAAAGALAAGAVYADLNTTAPACKRAVADVIARSGGLMADVAVLAPVPRAGLRTPLLLAGPGAARAAAIFAGWAVPVETVEGPAGAAAARKLLRSVFMKGLAAVCHETVAAARLAGAEAWARDQIAGELGPDGADLLDRMLDGTVRHAHRRGQEMRDALAYLDELDAPAIMTAGTVRWLDRLDQAGP